MSETKVWPGPSCEHTERIDRLEARLGFQGVTVGLFKATIDSLLKAIAAHEQRICELEASLLAAQSVGLVHDRRVTARRTSTTTPRPSKRGKGRRK